MEIASLHAQAVPAKSFSQFDLAPQTRVPGTGVLIPGYPGTPVGIPTWVPNTHDPITQKCFRLIPMEEGQRERNQYPGTVPV
eukprot:1026386-Rhodomonas_salina.2